MSVPYGIHSLATIRRVTMNEPTNALRTASTAAAFTASAIVAVLIIFILLLLKGGDRGFFAGVTIAAIGSICACASLFIAVYSFRSTAQIKAEGTAKKILIACIIIDGAYIALTFVSLVFAWVLFSALSN